jgi:L-lactate dehydrogenase
LDTNRLKQHLALRLGVAPSAVDGLVLGEHGDSEVIAFSALRVGGLPLDAFALPSAELDRIEIAAAVREAAYDIVAGKGYTSFGVATAIVRICEALIRDENVVLPVSTLLTGELGVADLYLSLPCVLGASGVERVLLPDLTDEEMVALRTSAAALHQVGSSLDDRP